MRTDPLPATPFVRALNTPRRVIPRIRAPNQVVDYARAAGAGKPIFGFDTEHVKDK
jgi:hypothetical protein